MQAGARSAAAQPLIPIILARCRKSMIFFRPGHARPQESPAASCRMGRGSFIQMHSLLWLQV